MNTRRLHIAFFVAAALATSIRLSAADELPALKQGLWSYSGTTYLPGETKPRVRNMKVCTDPAEDIRKKMKTLATQSCKATPVAHKGNEYVYSSSCEKNGVTINMKSTLQIDSDSQYHVTSETRVAGGLQKELVIAQRVSGCVAAPHQGATQPPSATTRVPSPSAKRTM